MPPGMVQLSGLLQASLVRPASRVACRVRQSSTTSTAPSLKLVAELRKRATVTIQKAREALIASNGDVTGALSWLENDRIATGQQKAQKVGGRFAGEGLIGVSVLSPGSGNKDELGIRAAMVEVNCETDFVGRNELFRTLAQDLAFTAAFLTDPQPVAHGNGALLRPIDISRFRDAPLMVRGQDDKNPSRTVSEAIRDAIIAVGENIDVRRAVAFVKEPIPSPSGSGLRISSYVHGALPPPANKSPSPATTEAQGKIGALVAIGLRTSPASRLRDLLQRTEFISEMSNLERALARQVVGFRPDGVRGEAGDALYNQAFDMLPTSGGQSVEKVLSAWAKAQAMVDHQQDGDDFTGLKVVDFVRWEVGEGL